MFLIVLVVLGHLSSIFMSQRVYAWSKQQECGGVEVSLVLFGVKIMCFKTKQCF